jgi:predicted negative regulator of RcsB-dependent stress response
MQTSRLILVVILAGALGAYAGWTFEYWHERDPANFNAAYYQGAGDVLKKQTADEVDKITQDLKKESEEARKPYGD